MMLMIHSLEFYLILEGKIVKIIIVSNRCKQEKNNKNSNLKKIKSETSHFSVEAVQSAVCK